MARKQWLSVGDLTMEGFVNADNVTVLATNTSGNALMATASGAPPSATAGYAVGCHYVRQSNGALYYNSGSVTSCTFTAIGTVSAGTVTLAMLDTGIVPSHVAKFAAISTPASDATGTLTITVTGAAATDIPVVTLAAATNAVYVTKAACTLNTLTVTLSGAGGAGTSVNYVIFRAAA